MDIGEYKLREQEIAEIRRICIYDNIIDAVCVVVLYAICFGVAYSLFTILEFLVKKEFPEMTWLYNFAHHARLIDIFIAIIVVTTDCVITLIKRRIEYESMIANLRKKQNELLLP